eukprot:TRINITY_DN5672_c0_g1_i1.p1 TRINITY_DN5672_c0_g1~~TRINITY_DN5672_c0_g1_i1.p1  ORF type:complete len:273 (-),score=53.01 TRINITY_DN5672_c0_g1_i1:197-982(-)
MSRGLDNFHPSSVYRVLRPDEDFNSHLHCCDIKSTRRIDQHIADGLTVPSHFISTTSSLANALKWLNTSNKKCFPRYFNIRSVIVRINISIIKSKYPNIASTAYDLSNSANRDHFLKTDRQKGYAAAYSEVVFTVIIPKEAVYVEYIVGMGNIGSNTVPNDSSFLIKKLMALFSEEDTDVFDFLTQKEPVKHPVPYSPILTQSSLTSQLPILPDEAQFAPPRRVPRDPIPSSSTYEPSQIKYIDSLKKMLAGMPPDADFFS